jgi:hypothetical protein
MLEWVLGRRTSAKKPLKAGQKKKPSYEESKKIAAKGDAKARAALAAHADLEPEFLYLFASDKDATVRRAVAENESSPLQADLLLARDVDQGVREELAYKIGRLVPTLTDDESESLAEMAFAVLEILATDQAPQIRTIIADEIKHLSNVPKRIILRLAKDAEATVASPILEYALAQRRSIAADHRQRLARRCVGSAGPTQRIIGGALEGRRRRRRRSGNRRIVEKPHRQNQRQTDERDRHSCRAGPRPSLAAGGSR